TLRSAAVEMCNRTTIVAYDTRPAALRTQSGHEDCGGLKERTQGVGSFWRERRKDGRKEAKIWRKPSASPTEKMGNLKK
ncbi:MAG TPA: hypothetical protein VFR42_02250, partial [Candidatus Acidoferrum sp.]|nr:hypothetical protein [Candidatus Acidoferrum sp.]